MQNKKKIDLSMVTPMQAADMKAEITHLERMLESEKRSRSPKIQDVAEFNVELDRKRKILANHTPKPFRGKNKDKAAKRIKELDSFIQVHMPKARDYYRKQPTGCNNDFERTVNQQIAFQTNPKIQKAVAERKNLIARLEPQDPTLRNIERLRR